MKLGFPKWFPKSRIGISISLFYLIIAILFAYHNCGGDDCLVAILFVLPAGFLIQFLDQFVPIFSTLSLHRYYLFSSLLNLAFIIPVLLNSILIYWLVMGIGILFQNIRRAIKKEKK